MLAIAIVISLVLIGLNIFYFKTAQYAASLGWTGVDTGFAIIIGIADGATIFITGMLWKIVLTA